MKPYPKIPDLMLVEIQIDAVDSAGIAVVDIPAEALHDAEAQ
jgi:hypothetical protein